MAENKLPRPLLALIGFLFVIWVMVMALVLTGRMPVE